MKRLQKITLQFESDLSTRWLYDHQELSEALERMARMLAANYTTGPAPQVTAVVEEAAEQPTETWVCD